MKGLRLGSLVVSVLSVTAGGCATAPSQPEYKASKVIERIGGLSETPDWATGALSMHNDGSDVVFVNTLRMKGDARPEACVQAAETQGRAAMLRYISENLTMAGQVAELDAAQDPGYESLTAFLAQGKISGVKPSARYWEKAEESDEAGARVLRLRCAAKLSISQVELKRQLAKATSEATGGNPEIRKKLLDAQSQFIEGLSRP